MLQKKNLKFFSASKISKFLLKDNLTKRFVPYKQTGAVNNEPLVPFFNVLASCIVSPAHTPSKTGATERKHRHIVEVGLTLLAHASVPLKFWEEAFLTTVFLINRLLSRVINNETPFYHIFGKEHEYTSPHLRVCLLSSSSSLKHHKAFIPF